MWAQDVAAMTGYHAGASAAAAAAVAAAAVIERVWLPGSPELLGLNPVVSPVPGNPGLMSQTLNVGSQLSLTSYADTGNNNFDAFILSSPDLDGHLHFRG